MQSLRSFEPFTFTPKPGLPLLVLACSATKHATQHWARFAAIYNGPMWQQVRAANYPETNIAAISALHGFLDPGQPIQWYEQEMDAKISHRLISTSCHVARLAKAIERAGSAYVFGGTLYTDLARAAVHWRPAALTNRTSIITGTFLEQRKQLGELIRRHWAPAETADLFAES